MSDSEISKEERLLRAVKRALTGVARDTATPPGLVHPLSEQTMADIRECLLVVSERERELAEEAGRPMNMRPRFTDEPKPREDVVIPLHKTGLVKDKPGD